jgi:1-deoxyxylulose-5-phosphate synthase
LPLAKKHGVGVVAFKTFGSGKLLGDTEGYSRAHSKRPRGKISSGGTEVNATVLPRLTVEECVHYTLSCDVDVALLGMSFANEQDAAFAAARSFHERLSEAKMAEIRRRAVEAVTGKGPCWWNPNPLEHA